MELSPKGIYSKDLVAEAEEGPSVDPIRNIGGKGIVGEVYARKVRVSRRSTASSGANCMEGKTGSRSDDPSDAPALAQYVNSEEKRQFRGPTLTRLEVNSVYTCSGSFVNFIAS